MAFLQTAPQPATALQDLVGAVEAEMMHVSTAIASNTLTREIQR